MLALTDKVMSQLKQKHPNRQSAKLGSLLCRPFDDQYPESVYTEINGEMVRQAALITKGTAGGLSGVDANDFRRILACKSFKQSSTRLRETIATMTRTLCTKYIDPKTIEPVAANRLIPLDKSESAVRPIGVGEVFRRMCGKCVMRVAKKDVVEASCSLQLCAGSPEARLQCTLCILYVDQMTPMPYCSSTPLNAFNARNRAAALHNSRILCPIIAIYAINTNRQPARLFVIGGK